MFNITDYNTLLKTKKCKRYRINEVNIIIDESYLYNDLFVNYINLSRINISSYNIKRINNNIFNNLYNLKYIYLNFPHVITYPENLCENLSLDLFEIKSGLMEFNSFKLAKKIKILRLIDTNVMNIDINSDNKIDNIYIDGGKLIEFICMNANIKSIKINYTKLNNIILTNLYILENINLENNKLTKIKYFDNLPLLKNLKLNDNYIEHVIPLNKFNKLNYLNLSNNNIEDISFLNECEDLVELFIDNNRITNPMFYNLFCLEILSISNNNIQRIDDNLFSSTFNLVKLNISNNCIIEVSVNAFINLDLLLEINLLDNPIKYMPIVKTFFDDLQNVHTSSIQENLCVSILNLKNSCNSDKNFYNIFFNDDEIRYILDNKEIHICTGFRLIDVLNMVCERFFNDSSDINILKKLLIESKDSCFIGKISSIVFSRCGIDNDVIMNINKEEEILIICANIQKNDNIINKRKEFINRTKSYFDNNLVSKYLKYFE